MHKVIKGLVYKERVVLCHTHQPYKIRNRDHPPPLHPSPGVVPCPQHWAGSRMLQGFHINF